jgi:hypothetical protein
MHITINVVSANLAHGELYSIQHYVITFFNDLPQVDGLSGHSGFLHQQNWPQRYNCNIVESGGKHHCTNQHFVHKNDIGFVKPICFLLLYLIV